MSRLDKIIWSHTSVSLAISGSVNIPEISGPPITDTLQDDLDDPLSPTLSVDSGRSTSTDPWPSHNYLIYGGPGFSVATLDSSSGSVNRIPVPVPLPPSADAPYTQFSLSTITALEVVGECQVWAGTETGSLHVLDLTHDLRFSGHSFTNLPDPVTSIQCCHQTSSPGQKSRVNILVGGTNGHLTILSGQTNEKKGIKSGLRNPRKVIQLSSLEESEKISCMTVVTCDGVDMCWCGYGASIIILRCSDWKQLAQFDARTEAPPDELTSKIEVTTLVDSDLGVWSSLSQSSALTLWDKHNTTQKKSIICWDSYSAAGWLLDSSAQISTLNYCYPLLFVGTKGGDLMVFRLSEDKTDKKVTHKLITGTHCSSSPIVSIHPTPLDASFPLSATPTPPINALVVCGDTTSSSGCAQLYELISSPQQSPLTSPMSATGRLSAHSTPSTPSASYSLKRLSIDYGSLPPLSLIGSARTLLPLRTN